MVDTVKQELRASITAARKARDVERLSVLRQTLAAIENAEATDGAGQPEADPESPIALSVRGVGAGDVPRRAFGAGELRAVLERELREHLDAAAQADGLGREELAGTLRRQAEVVRGLVALVSRG